MPRVPLLAGSRLVVVSTNDDALETIVPRAGGRATVVVEPPALPLPAAERDPRQAAIAAAVDELERLGIPTGYQTLLVAGGLARRAGQEELASLVAPEFARRFHGQVEVHDVEDPA